VQRALESFLRSLFRKQLLSCFAGRVVGIEEAQASASTLAERYSRTFSGRAILQFITQPPFQSIKHGAGDPHMMLADPLAGAPHSLLHLAESAEFPFALRFPSERIKYSRLFTLANLRSLRLVGETEPADLRGGDADGDALTIQFEVRLNSTAATLQPKQASAAPVRGGIGRTPMVGERHGHERLVTVRFDGQEEATFVCEVVDKSQLATVLTSYGALPDRRGVMVALEQRDAVAIQIRGLKAEVDLIFVDATRRITRIQPFLQFSTINSTDHGHLFVVDSRDRVSLLPHLAAGNVVDFVA
jgi:hypothetical protein